MIEIDRNIKVTNKEIIYISHPSGGKLENTEETANIIRKLYKNKWFFDNCIAVSPIHNFSFMYNDTSYTDGLQICIDLLIKCDMMLVFGDYENSKGCCTEIDFCKNNNIPYLVISSENNLNEWLEKSSNK